MSLNAFLGQRAKTLPSLNLESEDVFPQLDPEYTADQAMETSDVLEVQLESSLSMVDVVFESAEVLSEVENIHRQQVEDDLVEDDVTTETLNAVLDEVSNAVVEPIETQDSMSALDNEVTVALEADAPADQTNAPTPTAAEAKPAAEGEKKSEGGFKERLKKWKKAIVDFIIKIKDWFINLITNYEKLGESLKAKAEELSKHFATGKEFKFTVKSASVVGDKVVGSTNDITGTFGNLQTEIAKLAAKTNVLNDANFTKEEVSFPVFGGTATLSNGDFKITASSTEKKDVELTMTSTVANQLKGSCDKLAEVFKNANKAKKDMADAARAAENELRKDGSGLEENKDNIKRIRNAVVFINNVYKLAGQQAKILLKEVLPVRESK